MLESRLKQNNENTIEVLDYCNLYWQNEKII
jgi:hypothetical protein